MTQRLWVANPARRPTLESGPASRVGVDPGDELVGHRLAEAVVTRRVHEPPVPAAGRVDDPTGPLLGRERRWPPTRRRCPAGCRARRAPPRAPPRRPRCRAVHLHVQADVEQVLVERGGQLRGDHRWRSGARLPGRDGHGGQDAGQLHLELDGAVEVEVPVEAVLVVAHGGDRAHHQPPRPADLGRARCAVLCFQRIP